MTLAIPAALITIGLFAFSAAKKGNAVNKITLEVADIKAFRVNNWTLYFNLLFQSTNPTTTPVTFDYIFLEVFSMDIKLGKVEQRKLTKIPPQETTQLSLPVQLSLKKILFNYPYEVAQLIKNGAPKTITVKGYIRSNGITFPYEDTIEL